MNFAASLLPETVVAALGWTLVHSLWQGALAALGFAVILYFSRRASASARYAMGLAVLVLVLLGSAVTFWNHYAAPAAAGPAALVATGGAPAVAAGTAAVMPSPLGRALDFFGGYFSRHLPLIVTLWLLGVMFLSLRFAGGMLYAQRLKASRSRPLPTPWPERLQALAERAGLRRPVRLLESLRLRTPVVIGHLKPVLLLPAGLVTGLPASEVEALLAHELAHVLRRDYLVNVLQNLLEIVYFFHPGVRWISSCVRQEREHCCDDIAVELCGDAPGYARALASLQAGGAPAMPAVAASGGSLLQRVSRLLAKPQLVHDFREGFLSALLLVAGLLAMVKLAAAPAATPVAAPGAATAAVEPDTARFGRIGFVLDADGKVKLSGLMPAGLDGQAGTWIVNERDGGVVWYMALGAKAGSGGTPFQEEVSLRRGTYSWYLPTGLAASASLSGAARPNAAASERHERAKRSPSGLEERRQLEEMQQAMAEAGKVRDGEKRLALEHEIQEKVAVFEAERAMGVEDRRKFEGLLRALAGEEKASGEELTRLQHEMQVLLAKFGAAQERFAAERLRLDEERQLHERELQSRLKEEQARVDHEQQLKKEELSSLEEEMKSLQGAERERRTAEMRRLQAELEALEALEEKQKAEAQERVRQEEQRRRAEEERQREFAGQAAREDARLKEADERLRVEEQRLREEEERLRAEGKRAGKEAEVRLRQAEERLRTEEKRLRQEEERLRREEENLNKFIARLAADGLVDGKGDFKIELSATSLLINGKKLPAEAQKKYGQLYETLSGRKLDKEQPVTIVHEQ